MKKRCGTLPVSLIQICFYGEKAGLCLKDEKTPRSFAVSVTCLLRDTAIMGNGEVLNMPRR